MGIRQFRYSSDNLSYLVYGDQSAIAIDGGAVEPIRAFIKANSLQLKYVTNTHKHPDHTAGTGDLVKLTGAEYNLIKGAEATISDMLLALAADVLITSFEKGEDNGIS